MNSRQRRIPATSDSANGFTLLEILVAIFIFAVVITTIFGSFRAVFSSVDAVGGDAAVFDAARICLDRMATDLGGLVIADYPRYAKPEFNDPPDIYRLVGESAETFLLQSMQTAEGLLPVALPSYKHRFGGL